MTNLAPQHDDAGHEGMRPCPTSTTNADITSNLSAMGSMNLAEVGDEIVLAGDVAVQIVGKARQREDDGGGELRQKGVCSANTTNTGIMQARKMVSLFGRFMLPPPQTGRRRPRR